MARPAATPEQRQEQRRKIRRAAAELYAEEGVSGVSVRAIAKRAGISPGTVYSYFSSLHEVLRSLWTEPVALAGERLAEIAAAEPDPVARIEALLTGYAEFARAEPEIYRSLLLFVRPTSLPAPDVQPLERLAFHRLLRTAVEDGHRSGTVRSGDADTMAQMLWAGLHGALALPINIDGYGFAPPRELAAATIPALVRAIRPDPDDR